MMKRALLFVWACVGLGAAVGFSACSSGDVGGGDTAGVSDDAGDDSGFSLGDGAVSNDYVSLSIEPATASIDVDDGMSKTQAFTLVGLKSDGSKETVTEGVSWSATNPGVGAIAAGTFTAN